MIARASRLLLASGFLAAVAHVAPFTRRFEKVGDIVRVGRGIWGLKEWYPNRSFKPRFSVRSDPLSLPTGQNSGGRRP